MQAGSGCKGSMRLLLSKSQELKWPFMLLTWIIVTEDETTSESAVQPESDPERAKPLERLQARIDATFKEEMAPYLDRIIKNFNRTSRLLEDSKRVRKDSPESADDILRAIVVFLHASLEDFLRTVSQSLLPLAGESALNAIPLAGLSGRSEKFQLGRLVAHKGKLVDDVIRESVSEYLERSNYNNVGEIALLLETLGFNVAEHNKEFPQIQSMMQRRHQIVHRADESKMPFFGNYDVQSIDPDEVWQWLRAVQGFMAHLCTPIFLKKLSPEMIADKFGLKTEDK